MKELLNTYKDTILLGVVIVLAVWNIINTNNVKIDVKSYKQEIKTLQNKVDSVKIENKEIDVKISGVKDKVNTITNNIHQIDNNLTVVRQKTNEKVISVELIGNTELERLLTERYKN